MGALAPGIGILYIGYSIMEGVGSALLIPPVYILATVNYTGTESRAKAYGTIAAAGGDRGRTGAVGGRLHHHRYNMARLLHPAGPYRLADTSPGKPDR